MEIQDTIHGLFEEQARRTPEDIAIICQEHSITYQRLNERSNQMAHYLLELGVQSETPVAVCMERSIDLLCAILAVLKVGGYYIPLDPSHPEARLLFTLTDNNHPLVITKSNFETCFIHSKSTLLVLDHQELIINTQPNHRVSKDITSEQLAYVIYTSGSTGKPKGTMIEHKSVVNYCKWFVDYSGCQRADRIDFSSNHIFDMAVTTSIVPLMTGLTIVICNDEVKKEVRQYLKYLETNRVKMIKMTPSYFKVLLHDIKSNPIGLPDLETIILGGENLPTSDCSHWLGIYPKHTLINEYGPTEATVAVSHYKINSIDLPSLGLNVPIGQPGPNMTCHIMDDNRLVADGNIGELFIGGVCLARGYLNQPELTEKQFVKNLLDRTNHSRLYKTGDLCKKLPNGVIEYLGRMDNQVKIRGFRIEPGEIEKCLMTHPCVKDVVVLAQKNEIHEKLIGYYILNDNDDAPNVGQLQKHLSLHLPEYMIPTAFVRVEEFPLTSNGKLDAQALPIPRFTTNQHYLAPCTALEKSVAKIWAEELGLKLIGIEDNFFELGGHSLSAARIISKINSTLGKEITLRVFYETATIRKLLSVAYYEKNNDEKSLTSIPSEPDNRTVFPLTDFQLLLWLSKTFEPKAKKLNIIARKRVKGPLNREALTFAFNAVLKKHDILFYHVLKLRPAQQLQKSHPFSIIEKNLTAYSEQEAEQVLMDSINALGSYSDWRKGAPQLTARLFLLDNDEAELHIGMPHIISDGVSPNIIFSDLSMFYLSYSDSSTINLINTDIRYRDYQEKESLHIEEHATRDILFWEKYLDNAHLFAFSPQYIVKNMASSKLPYSTYTEIPEDALTKLQQFCAENCISINDGLCAVLSLALVNCCDGFTDETTNIFMNIVKSTRGNQRYDETVGCFLKLEPIKVGLNKQSHLIGLSKQIHQSTIDTAPYQQCSSLAKLACIRTLRQKKNRFKKYLIGALVYLYSKIITTPKIDRKILNLCYRLTTTKKTNYFVINVNVHQSFIGGVKSINDEGLFGLKPRKMKQILSDLLEIDRFLDVCLLRDDGQNTPYIAISANLLPSFRAKIAKEMVRIIETETKIGNIEITTLFDRIPNLKVEKVSGKHDHKEIFLQQK